MTVTQSNTQSLSDLEAAINDTVEAGVTRSAPARPVDPKAGGGGRYWGPSIPRSNLLPPNSTEASQTITSPLKMLSQVADHTIKLHEQLLALTGAITGELPPTPRLRQAPRPSGGLLPAIVSLAHEIEEQQIEMARLVEHVKGRLA